jgi:hypothetical protein
MKVHLSRMIALLLDNFTYLSELAIDTTYPTSVPDYLSAYSSLGGLEFRSRYLEVETTGGLGVLRHSG